jgi:hypothetical protein
MTVKLNLLFILMDLLTLLIYPILFIYGRLRQFAKSNLAIPAVRRLTTEMEV